MLWESAHGFPWFQSPNYNFLLILNKVYLLEKYLAGGSDCKESTLNAGDLGRKDPLEKGMATHSSIFLWRIPWAEEPGRPQSMGSKRVGHDWAIDTLFQVNIIIYTTISQKINKDMKDLNNTIKQQDLIPTCNPIIAEYTLFFKWEVYGHQDINKLYLGP